MNSKEEYIPVVVAEVGFADANGAEGVLKLKSGDESFSMRAFSGEVAMHVSRFMQGDRSSIPSIFNLIEAIAEQSGLHLEKVEVYPAGNVLRSDLTFVGRDKIKILSGYRASDAIALAIFYDVRILLHHSLLKSDDEGEQRSRETHLR
jgi:bifunctional DNase/RNase